jgi:hypothetical protein
MPQSLPVRIVVLDPPPGVRFAIQSGKADLLPPTTAGSDAIVFDVEVRLGPTRADGAPALMPPLAHGPAGDRFIYVNSGVLAGEATSPWTRRAKVKTAEIVRTLVDEALAHPDSVVEGRIAGTGRGGGPPAGTVPLLAGWRLVPRSA